MEQALQGRLKVYIGTSGWQYRHWRSILYPPDLKTANWLNFYNKYFDTVEVNTTFYRNVKPSTFEKWHSSVNEKFIFSIKISREITHFKKLKIDKSLIDNFLERASRLEEKLGVILIQLPPSLKFDQILIDEFLSLLNRKYKYAIEVRNKTFIDDKFFTLLKRKNIAFCIADSAGKYPFCEEMTADFIYIRLHGSKRLYASEYIEEELIVWEKKIRNWNKLTFVYFDNDFMGFAVKNALRLRELLTFNR